MTSLHKEKYGAWSGNPKGRPPIMDKCCVEVWSTDKFSMSSQCSRKRGYGPESAYCKVHDPAYVKEKREAQDRAYNEKMNKLRYQWHGKEFFGVLEKIAQGHNDPRSLATETIDRFKSGEEK